MNTPPSNCERYAYFFWYPFNFDFDKYPAFSTERGQR